MSASASVTDSSPVDLQALHTFGLRAKANALRVIQSQTDLHSFAQQVRAGEPVLLLGEGSNTVFTQPNYAMTVWLMRIKGKQRLGCNGTHHLVRAMAGENWHSFVEWTVAQGLPGLENLALIPGAVGASPVQNIGAYGVELESRLAAVHVWDVQQACFRVFTKAECQFSYRESVFKQVPSNTYIITAVDFALPVKWQAELGYGDVAERVQELGGASPKNVMKAVIDIRSSKLPDPVVLGNSGSFFKNPIVPAAQAQALRAAFPGMVQYPMPDGQVKLAAGWLIEQCGLKGFKVGDVGVYHRQALILVNHGRGQGGELVALMNHIQSVVQVKFGVALSAEPNLI